MTGRVILNRLVREWVESVYPECADGFILAATVRRVTKHLRDGSEFAAERALFNIRSHGKQRPLGARTCYVLVSLLRCAPNAWRPVGVHVVPVGVMGARKTCAIYARDKGWITKYRRPLRQVRSLVIQ